MLHNVASTLLPFNLFRPETMSMQHSTLSKGRTFTINSFDIVAVLSTKSNVASTLLLVWMGLYYAGERPSSTRLVCR